MMVFQSTSDVLNNIPKDTSNSTKFSNQNGNKDNKTNIFKIIIKVILFIIGFILLLLSPSFYIAVFDLRVILGLIIIILGAFIESDNLKWILLTLGIVLLLISPCFWGAFFVSLFLPWFWIGLIMIIAGFKI
jgi:hypothetical protein